MSSRPKPLTLSGLPGEEKTEPATSPATTDFLVGWDGDNDPMNPRSLPLARKWLYVVIVSVGSMLVYVLVIFLAFHTILRLLVELVPPLYMPPPILK
jgi:hypothetical protein